MFICYSEGCVTCCENCLYFILCVCLHMIFLCITTIHCIQTFLYTKFLYHIVYKTQCDDFMI